MEGKARRRPARLGVLGIYSDRWLGGMGATRLETDGNKIFAAEMVGQKLFSPSDIDTLEQAALAPDGSCDEAADLVCETAAAGLIDLAHGADLIGYHGETLRHLPEAGRSDQAGQGRVLAEAAGIPIVADFRSNDMELGGAGGPLMPVFLRAVLRSTGKAHSVLLVDLGHSATLSYVSAEESGGMLSFHAAPGPLRLVSGGANRPSMDTRGPDAFSAVSRWSDEAVSAMLDEAFAARYPPKFLRVADFPRLRASALDGDAMTAIAIAVADGVQFLPKVPELVLLSGFGARIPFLRKAIAASLGRDCAILDDLGYDELSFRAAMTAFLAARVVTGLPTSFPETTGVPAPVGGGAVFRP